MKKEKLVAKDKIATALYDTETNSENKMVLENVDVQNQDAFIMSTGEKKKHQGKMNSKGNKIKNNSPSIDDQKQ